MFKKLLAVGLIASIGTGATAAGVDFSNNFGSATTHGDTISRFDFGNGLTGFLSVENFGDTDDPGEARIFDTTLSNTADDDLEGPFTNSDGSGEVRGFGKALIIQERPNLASAIADDERAGGAVTFVFDTFIDLFGISFLDGEEGATVTALMQDVGGFGSGVSGDNLFTDIDLGGSGGVQGISQFKVTYNGSGAIGALDIRVSAVPLPAGLPLLLAGLGGLAALRRKRTAI